MEKVENFYLGAELCKRKDKGGCITDITIAHCDFPDLLFSTKFNTLSFEEFEGWEADTKTKEVNDKNQATHYEENTSIAWKTNIKIDACKAENEAFFDFIDDNTFRKGGKAATSFMNRFIIIETSYDKNGVASTTRRTAILLSYSGRNSSDEESKNETEFEFHAYGDPQISTFVDPSWLDLQSKVRVTFDIVDGSIAGTSKIENSIIANATELCNPKFPYQVQYYGLLKPKADTCKPEYFDILNESMILLKDAVISAAITTMHEEANTPQVSTDFQTVMQTADIYKVIAVVDFNDDGTLIKVGEKDIPETVVTP
jgi:hypothetical protein